MLSVLPNPQEKQIYVAGSGQGLGRDGVRPMPYRSISLDEHSVLFDDFRASVTVPRVCVAAGGGEGGGGCAYCASDVAAKTQKSFVCNQSGWLCGRFRPVLRVFLSGFLISMYLGQNV